MASNLANPAGIPTDQENLDFARTAVSLVTMNGQAYGQDGRQLTRADLPSLLQAITYFESRVNATAAAGTRNAANLARIKRPA